MGIKVWIPIGIVINEYASKNGMMGMASVDSYNLTYKDEKGKKKMTVLYLSFYDYEEPKIPVGFYSIESFEK